ncbi:flagellar motor protein MotB [Pelagibius marinus]|uniref:flagellar motor protein MotB n=1 Tax=Pelagibius marinus TaxID=2762760 RepID=UPI0029CA028A|nr:flagellar motor protein MotB [Pelagibius marinus]
MAAGNDEAQIIIIKKVKKGGGGAHHGGAWKVAYADFVTAMMAFFLLLWLLNATTEEQRKGIAEYFSPITSLDPDSVSQSDSGSGGVMGGRSMTTDGALVNDTSPIGITVALPGAKDDTKEQSPTQVENPADDTQSGQRLSKTADNPNQDVNREEVDRLARELEQERFAAAEAELRQALESIPDLSDFSKNLIVDQTPEGMRIQIIDQEGRSMFASGKAEMYPHTQRLLALVADAIKKLDNPVAIKGHTDSTPYSKDNGYSNWELSTDRANSSRRALLAAGLPASRIASVVGRADQEHLVPDEPFSPRNRRISIVLLRQAPESEAPVYQSDN